MSRNVADGSMLEQIGTAISVGIEFLRLTPLMRLLGPLAAIKENHDDIEGRRVLPRQASMKRWS